MRSVYIVRRRGEVGYDEFDSFVVVATDEREARQLAQVEADENESWAEGDFINGSAEELTDFTTSRVIHSSFNAG